MTVAGSVDLFDAMTPDGQHDPGGKRMIRLAPDVTGDAVFHGPNQCYRLRLSRVWGAARLTVLLIMMNPSTANPLFDDPTIFKVMKMARRWHNGAFGRLLIGNVFAYRATDQKMLARVDDPIGEFNDAHLLAMAAEASLVVFAYGSPTTARLRARGPVVVSTLMLAGVKPHILRLTDQGVPGHPLYLPDATDPTPWNPWAH